MSSDIEKEICMKVEKQLGRGSFATVYYCTDNKTGQPYAVKIFQKRDFTKSKLQSFRKEAQILSSIEHKNVVKFRSFLETDSRLYLIMEFIAGGTLKQLMSNRFDNDLSFEDEEVSLIIRSTLEGIQYLHRFNIIHRDLKPENILVADPGDLGSIKIVDFGLSAQIDGGSSSNVKCQCGTLLYMAPQILHQPSYSKAVDIWSCAVIMHILYTGKHPLFQQNMRTEQFKQKLKHCSFSSLPNELANNFIKNLSKVQYTERYSANQALRHPWITRNEDDQIPLSVNDSIHGFDTSHLLGDLLKFLITIISSSQKQSISPPQQYRQLINSYIKRNQQFRSRSPSYRRCRRQANNHKQLIVHKVKDQEDKSPDKKEEVQSPLLQKHQKLFLRLFEKQKAENYETNELEQSLVLQKVQITHQRNNTIEPENTISVTPSLSACNSFVSSRNNCYSTYNIEMPLIKINQQERKTKVLRKLNSLREDGQKPEQNLSYFKSQYNTRLVDEKRIFTSKSKRGSCKIPINRNVSRKPVTSQKGRSVSKIKDAIRPMIFGYRTGFS